MKALSILQPWAWSIAHGYKSIENRTWATGFRGRFLIHAGKRWGREQREDLDWIRARFPDIPFPDTFDLGGVVGSATMTGCVMESDSPWFSGPFGFVVGDAKPHELIPYKGKLGWFDIHDPHVLSQFTELAGRRL